MPTDSSLINKVPFVDLKRQHENLNEEISAAIFETIDRCDFIGGKAIGAFEQAFAEFCNVSRCVGVANGTDALELALRACDVGPGDEVITVANTFIGTSEAITAVGATSVFVDCGVDSYLIDIHQIMNAITSKTKAIVPVHLYGQLADMDSILALAHEYGIYVIEDAAQAHGAERDGKRAGSFGDIGCFSFYPGKNLGAFGDAGAVVTNNDNLADKVRLIANHGRATKHDHVIEGMNSRLDTLQAAILKVKLQKLDKWNSLRRLIAKRYLSELSDLPLVMPALPNDGSHVYHLFVVRTNKRDMLMKELKERSVGTGIHYPIALPHSTAYRHLNHSPTAFPNATQFSGEILSLPMFPLMSNSEIEFVVSNLSDLLHNVGSF